MREFHQIIEFSFNVKKEFFTIRFLDGTCLKSPIKNLPIRLQIRSAKWAEAKLGEDQESLVIPTKTRKKIKIAAHELYSAGRAI